MKERPNQELVNEGLNAVQRSPQPGLIHHSGQGDFMRVRIYTRLPSRLGIRASSLG